MIKVSLSVKPSCMLERTSQETIGDKIYIATAGGRENQQGALAS
jgi:hypothetical protein